MGLVPAVDVDHAVAAVHFNHRRDQHDHVRADVLDVRRIIDGEAIGQLHQRCRRAGFDGVDGAGDVVDRVRLIDQRAGLGVVEIDGARIAELGQTLLVGIGVLQQVGIGNGHRDHLAAFFGVADGEDLHARAGSGKHAEVLVDVFGVGQHVGRAGDIARALSPAWERSSRQAGSPPAAK